MEKHDIEERLVEFSTSTFVNRCSVFGVRCSVFGIQIFKTTGNIEYRLTNDEFRRKTKNGLIGPAVTSTFANRCSISNWNSAR